MLPGPQHCGSAAADFSSRKVAKTQRDFSLHFRIFVRSLFISLRLCAFARPPFFSRKVISPHLRSINPRWLFFLHAKPPSRKEFATVGRLHVFVRQPFISLRLCAFAR
jgi:hypothetical protein